MGNSAPLNYLACDGTIYNITDYPELAQYFYQQFEASNYFGGDGTTTFAVPDLRGEFLRGTGTNSHTNQGNGATVGTHQDGTAHRNSYQFEGGETIAFYGNGGTSIANVDSDLNTMTTVGRKVGLTKYTASSSRIFYTARPTNTSVLYCIATKNIFVDAGSNYSTNEMVIGTWIDGKPIYQKTIELPQTTTATTVGSRRDFVFHLASDIANFGEIINFDGYILYNNTTTTPESSMTINVKGTFIGTSLTVNATCNIYLSGDLHFDVNKDISNKVLGGIVTIQYTKTTD